jgi:hypothetical protein
LLKKAGSFENMPTFLGLTLFPSLFEGGVRGGLKINNEFLIIFYPTCPPLKTRGGTNCQTHPIFIIFILF